jgi:chromosomal replication initiator protein
MRACVTESVLALFSAEPAATPYQAAGSRAAASVDPAVFLVGPENRLVIPVVQAVLDGTHPAWNPIFICGPSGSGKTHLAQAIAAAWRSTHPRRSKALYVAASDFARQLAEAIEAESVDDLRNCYRTASLAIFDEVGHLCGKVAAQYELVYTIDTLLAGGNRVVLTAAAAPWELPELMPALRSRMAAGLVVPLAGPRPATRKALLRHFADLQRADITEGALNLLADNCPTNPATLKGVIAQVRAGTELECRPIDEPAVSDWLRQRGTDLQTSLRQITSETCRYFSLRLADLRGQSRRRLIAVARGIAIYLVRELTNCSLKQIGQYFGRRDHTTVLHSYLKTKSAVNSDPETRKAVAAIRQRLQAPSTEQYRR